MTDHEKEKWVKVYKSAVFELRNSLMAGRIAEAREEIVTRVEALRDIPGLHKEEHQAIEDALHNLKFLEREAATITAEEKHQKAATALERLLEIGLKSERFKEVD